MANSSSMRSEPGRLADAQTAAHAGAVDDARLKQLLGYNLSRADIRVRKIFNRHLATLELRPVEYSVLVLIAANPQINQRQLGEALEISAPNLAVLLDKLAERNLVKRVRGDLDRRAQHPHLTAAGRKLVTAAERLALASDADLAAVLSEGERALLTELLQRLAGAAPALRPGRAGRPVGAARVVSGPAGRAAQTRRT